MNLLKFFHVLVDAQTTSSSITSLMGCNLFLSLKLCRVKQIAPVGFFILLSKLLLQKPSAMQMQIQIKCPPKKKKKKEEAEKKKETHTHIKHMPHTLRGHLFLSYGRCGHWLWWLIQNTGFDTRRFSHNHDTNICQAPLSSSLTQAVQKRNIFSLTILMKERKGS